MADVNKVKASDGTIYDVKDVSSYTKEETDSLLADKANVSDVYDKTEVDNLLAGKPDATVVEGELALKANVVDVYSKTEADNLLAGKADTGVSYTKAEEDALLGDKANAADVYTITQTDTLLDDKAGVDDSSTTATMATWSASKLNTEFQDKADSSDVYTKAEVDALIGGIKMTPLLDWSNPLFTFGSAGTSFTASEECYLYGSISLGNGGYVSVNGGKVNAIVYGTSTNFGWIPVPIRLISGDVVAVYNDSATIQNLGVYKERSV